jgi:hypothetical protein
LGRFVGDWSLEKGSEWHRKRATTPMAAITRYYDAMLGQMPAVIDHPDAFPLDRLPPAETRLLWMALSFVDCAMSVELYKSPTVPDGFDWRRLRVDP